MSAVLPRFLKFAGVGAIATAIQYGVLVASVELLGIGPVSGSCAGFLVGAVFNYWANYHFTFGSDNPHWVAASRFAVTATDAGVTGDYKAALTALGEVTATCVGCHAGYRLK